jgi:uncharacterized protein (TIGR03435 family)
MMLAMRTLLADRFRLVVHHETRQLDIYALTKAKPDGLLGPALKPTSHTTGTRPHPVRGVPTVTVRDGHFESRRSGSGGWGASVGVTTTRAGKSRMSLGTAPQAGLPVEYETVGSAVIVRRKKGGLWSAETRSVRSLEKL